MPTDDFDPELGSKLILLQHTTVEALRLAQVQSLARNSTDREPQQTPVSEAQLPPHRW
jgi:hypothetical protein